MNKYRNSKINELIQERNVIEVYKYINDNGLSIYDFNDKEVSSIYNYFKYGCLFNRENESKIIDLYSDEYYLIKNMLNNGLYKIDDNIDCIKDIQNTLEPTILFETYKRLNNIAVLGWSLDKNNATGKTAICYPMYYGYKLEDNIFYRGCIKSPLVEDILEIKDEYPYIKTNFYKYIHIDMYENIKKLTK